MLKREIIDHVPDMLLPEGPLLVGVVGLGVGEVDGAGASPNMVFEESYYLLYTISIAIAIYLS